MHMCWVKSLSVLFIFSFKGTCNPRSGHNGLPTLVTNVTIWLMTSFWSDLSAHPYRCGERVPTPYRCGERVPTPTDVERECPPPTDVERECPPLQMWRESAHPLQMWWESAHPLQMWRVPTPYRCGERLPTPYRCGESAHPLQMWRETDIPCHGPLAVNLLLADETAAKSDTTEVSQVEDVVRLGRGW